MIDVRASVRENSQSRLKRFLASSGVLWRGLLQPAYICDTLEEFKEQQKNIHKRDIVRFPRLLYDLDGDWQVRLKDFSSGSGRFLVYVEGYASKIRYGDKTLGIIYNIDIKKDGKLPSLLRFNSRPRYGSSEELFLDIFPRVSPVLA